MKLSFTSTLIFVISLVLLADARVFLDGDAPEETSATGAKPKAMEATPAQKKRIEALKVVLLPMFKSLPKNHHGLLVPQVARYALHRLFEQQHSWSVNGLRAARSDKDVDLFKLFTAGTEQKGISINSLASLAVVVEDRIHGEAVSQLKTTYASLKHEVSGREISSAELDVLVDRYMSIYISGMREYNLTDTELGEQRKYMERSTTDWNATFDWVRTAQHDTMRTKKPCGHGITDCSFDFQDTAYVVEEVVNRYGEFNHGECKRLKSTLLKMEDRKTGRVSLSDFYKEGMSGTWAFNEKVDYLRDLGTLDETQAGRPRVIVANYVNSWVNCLSSSSEYSVCCRNECEDLLGHLERHIESSSASPERILQIVRDFQSADIQAVSISELSKRRLQTIAHRHQGTIPLHGRLFAQWLHHVLPQMCPYPHAAGATNPLTPDEWMKERGHSAITATEAEIMKAVNIQVDVNGRVVTHAHKSHHAVPKAEADTAEDLDGEMSVPWTDVEEVFVMHNPNTSKQDERSPGLDAAVFLTELITSGGLVFAFLRMARVFRPRKVFEKEGFEKQFII